MEGAIGSLFVSISADLSGFDQALSTTRATLETIGGQGGLMGSLPLKTEQQAAQMVAGIQRALAPLPDALRQGLETPFTNALNRLQDIVRQRLEAIVGQINAAISQINSAISQIPAGGGSAGTTAIPGRAAGGSVFSGQPYVVGERGPELFVPGSSGTIIPNHVLNEGGGISIRGGTFHIYGVQDAQSLYDQLRDIADQRA